MHVGDVASNLPWTSYHCSAHSRADHYDDDGDDDFDFDDDDFDCDDDDFDCDDDDDDFDCDEDDFDCDDCSPPGVRPGK